MRLPRPQLLGSGWDGGRCGGTLLDVPLLPPPPSLSATPLASDDEQLALRKAARRAEDAGDLVGARRLLALLTASAEVQEWVASLDAGLRCRNDAERALWLLQPAFRHSWTSARRHVLMTLAADVLRTRGVAAVMDEPESAECAMRDPLLVDAGLFDLGMLADYVARVLVPGAHPLRMVLQSWVGRPAAVWEVQSVGADRLGLRDLADGGETVVSEQLPEVAAGDLLYGRIVPLEKEARFTAAPVRVDRVTARRVLRALVRAAPLAERLRAVASYQRRALTGNSS